nr:glycosyltransferase [uncultured Chitinophaga sp.]
MFSEKFAVSVIVPTYNRSQGMEYTIRSLIRQNIDKDSFEIVIADDGSTDNTFDVLKQYEDVANISYVYQRNQGYRPASARNLGIRAAKGKICLFIDSGIILKSDCLAKHIAFHASHGKDIAVIGYTYGYTQHGETEDELLSLVDVNDADKSIGTLFKEGKFKDVREKIYKKYNNRLDELDTSWTLFWGGHLSVPVNVLRRVGGFDENYDGNWGCEDNDLGYRILRDNTAIFLCKEAQVLHLPHGTNLDSKKEEGYTNCRYFHNKYQTPETRIFLDYYLKEITGHEVIDFNELFVNAKTTATSSHD